MEIMKKLETLLREFMEALAQEPEEAPWDTALAPDQTQAEPPATADPAQQETASEDPPDPAEDPAVEPNDEPAQAVPEDPDAPEHTDPADPQAQLQATAAALQAVEAEFAAYREAVAAEKRQARREAAFRQVLDRVGISPQRTDTVVRCTDMDSLQWEDDALKNVPQLEADLREEWADFLVHETVTGTELPEVSRYRERPVDLERISMDGYMTYRYW